MNYGNSDSENLARNVDLLKDFLKTNFSVEPQLSYMKNTTKSFSPNIVKVIYYVMQKKSNLSKFVNDTENFEDSNINKYNTNLKEKKTNNKNQTPKKILIVNTFYI